LLISDFEFCVEIFRYAYYPPSKPTRDPYKEALALERSEVESLCKALAKVQRDHAITKKENIALKKKYYDLDEKHKELEL
jgi:hypothetical protein